MHAFKSASHEYSIVISPNLLTTRRSVKHMRGLGVFGVSFSASRSLDETHRVRMQFTRGDLSVRFET